VAYFLPQLPALSVEVAAARLFTWVVPVETKFKDVYPPCFLPSSLQFFHPD